MDRRSAPLEAAAAAVPDSAWRPARRRPPVHADDLAARLGRGGRPPRRARRRARAGQPVLHLDADERRLHRRAGPGGRPPAFLAAPSFAVRAGAGDLRRGPRVGQRPPGGAGGGRLPVPGPDGPRGPPGRSPSPGRADRRDPPLPATRRSVTTWRLGRSPGRDHPPGTATPPVIRSVTSSTSRAAVRLRTSTAAAAASAALDPQPTGRHAQHRRVGAAAREPARRASAAPRRRRPPTAERCSSHACRTAAGVGPRASTAGSSSGSTTGSYPFRRCGCAPPQAVEPTFPDAAVGSGA